MGKCRRTTLSVVLALAMVVTNGFYYPGGGLVAHAEDKITISTAEELQKIGTDNSYPLSGNYVLEDDIDMTGIDFTPIGGGMGTRGAASGDNVFTGTFDGQGHIISNLTIHKTGNSSEDWQYGMFGMIGSEDQAASVKNLILTGIDINVDMTGSGYFSLGGLAGEVNHNALIDNVAIIDGTVQGNPSNGSDVVGVGGLIGEMRYESRSSGGWGGQQGAGDNGVTISNVYVGADVVTGASKDTNYAGGMIGRIAKTNPTSMTACVFTGNVKFKSTSGYGISGGDMTENISNCYYLAGSGLANTGTAVEENVLKAGTLLDGLSSDYWTAKEGSYVLPRQCADSQTIEGILALSSLSLELAEGDALSSVSSNFTVPMSVQTGQGTENVAWTVDKPEVISVGADGTVTVSKVYADTVCSLTATIPSGKTRTFRITVVGQTSLKIDQEYAVVGEALTASMVDAPEDMQCTYEWKIGDTVKATGVSYTPVSDDLEKMLTVTATASGNYSGTYQASMYVSKLPVLYVNTEGGQAITSKEDYINGDFKIQGNAQYNSENTTLYDGIIEIRGRGNTTWGYDKKPYKIKLDAKTDLFGFGANKHWVLLANYTDESHMRNMLSYNLSGEMGMPYMQSVHVDLILNGQYMGTYQFCEQVKISKGRINIHDWEDYAGDVAKAVYKAEKGNGLTKDDQDAIETLLAETDMSWLTSGKFNYKDKEYTVRDYLADMPDFTGGFLLELDSYYDEYSKFKTGRNQPLQFKSPEFIATNEIAMNYVKNYIQAFENAISAADYTTTYDGSTKSYSQLFDMDSLVQFWMVNELFMNVDAMKKSTYMYKDIDGLIHMGPIWDMDWSSDSLVSNYQGSGTYNVWQTKNFSDEAQANQWYKSIIQDPYFAVKAFELYTQMREKMGEMVADDGTLTTYQSLLAESAQANESLWYQSSGNNPWNQGDNQKKFTTQIQTLRTYLTNRLNWLDTQFASPETLAASLGYNSAGGISVEEQDIVTNDAGVTTITAKVTDSSVKSVEFLLNGVKLGTARVVDGTAALEAPADALASSDSYNTIQVFGLNEGGSVILSANKKVTDYARFKVTSQGSPSDPEDPTKPTDPEDPTKPTDPTDPEDPTNPTDPTDPTDPTGPTGSTETEDPKDQTDPDNSGNPAVGSVLNATEYKAKFQVTKSGEKLKTVQYEKSTDAKATSITIPDAITVGGVKYKVTAIAGTAFKGNKNITSLKIGNNVIKIENDAFNGCNKLKTVTIGKNVTSIGDKAFYKCTSLRQVLIPGKVTRIGKQAFYGCKKMTKVVIESCVKAIGTKAFAGCTKLKNVTIKTTKLTTKNVGNQALKGISSKAIVKVPAKKMRAYKNLLKKRGLSGKRQKIKKG